MTGVINLYKPKGITSSDAVVKVKKLLSTGAVGHMGTLDPQGEGVLILGVGKATRLFDYYLSKDKVYEAEFTFGVETDTLDGEGSIICEGGRMPTSSEITDAMNSLTGKLLQVPPLYSAKKVSGQKAYKLARENKGFTLAACQVEVYSFRLLNMDGNKIEVSVHCSSGTYIRSLCRDLAHKLNTYAIMTAIKRTRCGNFDISSSVKLEELTPQKLIPLSEALSELERLDLPSELYKKVSNGVKVPCDEIGKRLIFCRGELFGIGEAHDGYIGTDIYLRET